MQRWAECVGAAGRLVVALAITLLGLLILASPVSASNLPPQDEAAPYVYDSHPHAAPLNYVSSDVDNLAIAAGDPADGIDGAHSSLQPLHVAADAATDVAARRVTLRVGTKKAILDAQRAPDGKLYDPNTGIEIPEGGGHFGHRPNFEWWRTQRVARKEGWTRQQLIEYENIPSHYWYEDPSSNMSHLYQAP